MGGCTSTYKVASELKENLYALCLGTLVFKPETPKTNITEILKRQNSMNIICSYIRK